SVLPLPPPPPSLHPVQRGPAGSDTEGLEQAGIGFAQSLEHPSVPHHSSSFNVERSDNMQPSEPTPTELTHNPARAQSNPQQTPSQSMAHPQRDHGGPVASTSGHVPENQPPQPHSLGKRQIKVTPKARNMDTGRGSERIGPNYLGRNT
ncbi:hypothetical protein EDB84DRAFT_1442979, partial [Lactarius hengduanensis]